MIPKHWHGSMEHVIVAAIGTMVIFQVVRFGAARLATRDDVIGTAGKSVGALFSFPAQ